MSFNKEEYWANRKSGKRGQGPDKIKATHYTPHEHQAASYHKRVAEAVSKNQITKEQATEALKSSEKEAVEKLTGEGMNEVAVAVIEKIILHGSLKAAANATGEVTL